MDKRRGEHVEKEVQWRKRLSHPSVSEQRRSGAPMRLGSSPVMFRQSLDLMKPPRRPAAKGPAQEEGLGTELETGSGWRRPPLLLPRSLYVGGVDEAVLAYYIGPRREPTKISDNPHQTDANARRENQRDEGPGG